MKIIVTENAKISLENLNNSNYICTIYGHLCVKTNKWYIGYTHYESPEKRWGSNGIGYLEKRNGKFTQPKIARAIEKYGWESFDHYILDYCLKDNIDEFERKYIAEKNSFKKGYNSTIGGEKLLGEDNPAFGKIKSEEQINHLRKIFSGKNNPNYGKKTSESTKSKISNSLKRHWKNTKHPRKGIKLSKKQCQRISNMNKGRKMPDIVKQNLVKINKSRQYSPLSEETKLKISKSKYGSKSPVKRNVVQLDDDQNIINIFETAAAAGRYMRLYNGSQITACCKNKQSRSAGYSWRYIEDVPIEKLREFKKSKIE